MWAYVPWHTYELKGQLCGVGSLFPPSIGPRDKMALSSNEWCHSAEWM